MHHCPFAEQAYSITGGSGVPNQGDFVRTIMWLAGNVGADIQTAKK
jgi:hypothetical protein